MKNQKGQSTIEFLFSFMLSIGLFVMYMKLALNLSAGFLVHYATFMASRTYLSADNNSNQPDATDRQARVLAEEVFNKFSVLSFGISQGPDGFVVHDPESGKKPAFIGVKFNWISSLTAYKVLGGDVNLNMISESFLGREPVKSDCFQRICKAMEDIGGNCTTQTTLFDNGC